jgi:hypothetical protein
MHPSIDRFGTLTAMKLYCIQMIEKIQAGTKTHFNLKWCPRKTNFSQNRRDFLSLCGRAFGADCTSLIVPIFIALRPYIAAIFI